MKSVTKYVIPILAMTMVIVSCGEEKKQDQDKRLLQSQSVVDEEVKEYIQIDVSAVGSAEQGNQIEVVNNYRDEIYTLMIRKVQEAIPGVISISANIEDRETGLAILTITDEQISGSLEFYNRNLRYQIRYDSTQGSYYLVEIKEDALEGSEPLDPPRGYN